VVNHVLDAQNYGAGVDTGPSFLSQKQEAVDAYGKIAAVDKNFMSIAGDKFFRALDAPGSDEIADRYEKMLPAALQKQKGPTPDPAAMQQQMQQMTAAASDMIDRLTAKVNELQSDIDNQTVINASRERIAEMQEITKRVVAAATLDQKQGMDLLENELASIKHRLDLSQAVEDRQTATQQADQDRQQQAQQQQNQSQQQAQQAQQDRAHEAGMAGSQQAHEAGQAIQAQQAAQQLAETPSPDQPAPAAPPSGAPPQNQE
jgi:hypothetical protein